MTKGAGSRKVRGTLRARPRRTDRAMPHPGRTIHLARVPLRRSNLQRSGVLQNTLWRFSGFVWVFGESIRRPIIPLKNRIFALALEQDSFRSGWLVFWIVGLSGDVPDNELQRWGVRYETRQFAGPPCRGCRGHRGNQERWSARCSLGGPHRLVLPGRANRVVTPRSYEP